MKRTLLALCLLSVLGLPVAALAQTSAVPLTISYQGRVTDSSGVLIGTGTPVNREVIFRVYDSPTGGTLLYAEKQNVTIAAGEFSVLVGTGSQVGTEVKPALDTAFAGAIRYLGVTVDDGNAGADLEITPRQQVVATPFAFRARIAESLAANAISSDTMISNNAITGVKLANDTVGSSKITDLSIVSNDLADGAITSAKIADATIATADLANGAVTAAKLASDIGVWTVNGNNIYRTSRVAIGSNNFPTNDRLTVTGGNLRMDQEQYFAFGGTVTDTFSHSGKTMTRYGMGSFVDSNLGGTDPALWLSGNQGLKLFTAGAARLTITQSGQIGIGTTGPDDQLTVYSGNLDGAVRIQSGGTGFEASDGFRIGIDNNLAFINNFENTPILFYINGKEVMRQDADGRIGLGGSSAADCSVMVRNNGQGYPLILESGQFFFNSAGQAFKPNGGAWASSSDIRLKTDVQDLAGSLEKLLQLHSVTFRFKDEAKYSAGVQTGFIAQEVEKVFPTWVNEGPDGFKAVSIYGFESLTVQALRELRAEKDAQIAALEKRVETTEARLAALEKQLAALAARR